MLPPPPPPTLPPPRLAQRRRTSWPVLVALVAGLIGGLGGVLVGAWLADDQDDAWQRPSAAPVVTAAARPPDAVDLARLDVAAVVDRVEPSVVTVSADVEGADGEAGTSTGTGVVLTADGEVLTNAHVVSGASSVRVRLPGESEPRRAVVTATDPGNDLALVTVDADGLEPATFADPDSTRLGDEVVAIGYALDLDGGPSVTLGIVSGLGRTIVTDAGALDQLVQTDAAISSGNSGGPLVNAAGEIVGINTAVARGDTTTSANNIGFAISTGEVLRVIDELRATAGGALPDEGFLGVGLTDRTDGGSGALVTNVSEGSPAAEAGIQVDDVIVAIDGEPVEGRAGLIAAIRDRRPGDELEVEIVRDGRRTVVTATLAGRPDGS